MNVILQKNNINFSNIIIKNNNKILYNYNNVQLLGISILITNFEYVLINNHIKIKLQDDIDIKLIKNLDVYFKGVINNYKETLNENNIIFVKNVLHKTILDDNIYLNINSLKNKDLIFYLNILTL